MFSQVFFFFKAHHEKKIIVGDYAIPTGFYYLYLSLICQLTRFERWCAAVALIWQILLKHSIAVSFLKTCIMVTKMNNSVLSVALKILFDLYPLFHLWNFFWQKCKTSLYQNIKNSTLAVGYVIEDLVMIVMNSSLHMSYFIVLIKFNYYQHT